MVAAASADNLDQVKSSSQSNPLDILALDGIIDRQVVSKGSCQYVGNVDNGYWWKPYTVQVRHSLGKIAQPRGKDDSDCEWIFLEPTLWVPQRIIEESPTPALAPTPTPVPIPVPTPTPVPTPVPTPAPVPVPASKGS